MALFRLTRDELYKYLDEPFNPPTGENQGRIEFEREWWNVRNHLDRVLSNYGEMSAYSDADYNLGEQITDSRGLGVEVTSTKMLNRQLVSSIQSFLRELTQDWEVDLAYYDGNDIMHLFIGRVDFMVYGDNAFCNMIGLR